jgi:hypothetical protein
MWNKEQIIQNIKDCGQSLIDNAENIVNCYKYATGFTITLSVDERDESPYISVNTTFNPEQFVERFMN